MPTTIIIDTVTLTLKKYTEFIAGTPAPTDITLFANPTTGDLFKCTLQDIIDAVPPTPSMRFGFPLEDVLAGENRSFNTNGFDVVIGDGNASLTIGSSAGLVNMTSAFGTEGYSFSMPTSGIHVYTLTAADSSIPSSQIIQMYPGGGINIQSSNATGFHNFQVNPTVVFIGNTGFASTTFQVANLPVATTETQIIYYNTGTGAFVYGAATGAGSPPDRFGKEDITAGEARGFNMNGFAFNIQSSTDIVFTLDPTVGAGQCTISSTDPDGKLFSFVLATAGIRTIQSYANDPVAAVNTLIQQYPSTYKMQGTDATGTHSIQIFSFAHYMTSSGYPNTIIYFENIPAQTTETDVVYYNTSTGQLVHGPASGVGGTPGIDDVLAIGQLLTASRVIDINGNDIQFINTAGLASLSFAEGGGWWYSFFDATHWVDVQLSTNGTFTTNNYLRFQSYFAGTQNNVYIYPDKTAFDKPLMIADGTEAAGYVLTSDVSGNTSWQPTSSGFTNLTQFVSQNNWKTFYSDGSGDVQELTIGATSTVLTSNGTTSAPSFQALPADTNFANTNLALSADRTHQLAGKIFRMEDASTGSYIQMDAAAAFGSATFHVDIGEGTSGNYYQTLEMKSDKDNSANTYIYMQSNFSSAFGFLAVYPNFIETRVAGTNRYLRLVGNYTPGTSTDATYPAFTLTADDTYIWYRTSGGTWKKIAWTAF